MFDACKSALTPGEQGNERLSKIVTVRQIGQFQNDPVFLRNRFLQILPVENEMPAFQKMQILDQVKHAFAGHAEFGCVLILVSMYIAVAEFMIQIPKTQFDIVDFIFPSGGRKIIRQYADQVFRSMTQLAYLQRTLKA